MGLRERVAAIATRRAHVLIVEMPGEALLRLHAEAGVAGAGWAVATTPADADVLLVCGPARGEALQRADRLWDQMVAPRARVAVASAADVPPSIAAARSALIDDRTQRADAKARAETVASPEPGPEDPGPAAHHDERGPDPHSDGADGMAHRAPAEKSEEPQAPMSDAPTGGPSSHEHHTGMGMGMGMGMDTPTPTQMDMDKDMGMDMDMDMDMTGPAGIALAQGGPDRDGLEMDVLRVALGPVLPAWPADLILRCTLQGDVITSAHGELVPPESRPAEASPDELSALLVDAAARLMQLAGWEPVATELRRVRDDLLSPSADRASAERRLQRVSRRIRRSRTLRWSLRGMRPAAGQVPAASPDVHALLMSQLEHAAGAVRGSRSDPGAERRPLSSAELATAVEGKDLAAARLIVAGLTPWGSVSGPPVGLMVGATDD